MSRTRTVALLCAALAAFASGQTRTVVFDFQVVDVEPGLARTTALLLGDRLTDNGFLVVAPPAGDVVATVDQAVAIAGPLGCDKAVLGSITRLGYKFIISYKLVDVASGTVEFSDRATISNADELDIATERIGKAIKEQRPFAATGEVGKVTEAERRRSSALSSFFLTTGYTFPVASLSAKSFPMDPGLMLFTIDAAVTYETPNILAQGQMGLRRGKHAYTEVFFDLLVHKLFSTSDVSPYIGGGLGVHKVSQQGPGYADVEDDGLALIASAGVILFRTQYFRIVGGAKASVLFTEDFGTNAMAGFNFGLTSPTLGPGGGADLPSPCVYGALGLFFLTGLIVALTT